MTGVDNIYVPLGMALDALTAANVLVADNPSLDIEDTFKDELERRMLAGVLGFVGQAGVDVAANVQTAGGNRLRALGYGPGAKR